MEYLEKNCKIAVLIDADNVSPRYIKYILDEISDYGVASYKRIYGDWTDNTKRLWKEVLLEWSINPVQQYSYTTGKNSTDSALIIDAMDILYSGNVEGFCIVSSDSDFTRLAQRLREAGMFVMGIGEKKTPRAFMVACDVFKILEVISQEDDDNNIEGKSITSLQDIKQTISKVLMENNNQGRQTNLGEIGSILSKKYSEFDVRNYGFAKLSTFLESMKEFDVIKKSHSYLVTERLSVSKEMIGDAIESIINDYHGQVDNLSVIHDELRKRFPEFDVKQYGFSRVSSLIRSFNHFKIYNNKVKLDPARKGVNRNGD